MPNVRTQNTRLTAQSQYVMFSDAKKGFLTETSEYNRLISTLFDYFCEYNPNLNSL